MPYLKQAFNKWLATCGRRANVARGTIFNGSRSKFKDSIQFRITDYLNNRNIKFSNYFLFPHPFKPKVVRHWTILSDANWVQNNNEWAWPISVPVVPFSCPDQHVYSSLDGSIQMSVQCFDSSLEISTIIKCRGAVYVSEKGESLLYALFKAFWENGYALIK